MQLRQLDKIYKKSKKIKIDDSTKIVIMSDNHRGSGDIFDNFEKNKDIYIRALDHYYYQEYTYIELGDGDDLWEVKDFNAIITNNIDIFRTLKKFYQNNRLFMIYGNHDIEKRNPHMLKKYLYNYYDEKQNCKEKLFENIEVYESLILEYQDEGIFLIHGHQVDFINSNLWRLSRFFIRTIWRKLEFIGIKDPTKSAKKYTVSESVEKKLQEWSKEKHKLLIAGHTHRPIMPNVGDSLYFNDGSCIHPNGITCIEIEKGRISLVKWEHDGKSIHKNIIKRTVLGGPTPIKLYF